ncbi:DUF305 domain-containing protein [Arenimonas sp.]|nr:DUF305 domain-containing protein [Candidatus Parcubacteria bacterium]
MNKNNIIVGIIALLIGITGTNIYRSSSEPEQMTMKSSQANTHMMPDGSMMGAKGMDSMMDDMTTNMKGKSGKELEKAFLSDMIPHHQGAVDMAKLLLQDKSIRPELVKFANAIISAQESEIGQMKEWLKKY